ncbi:MAG: CADD family putative folate metabolism protein [Luteitalea sp.]|nr:CADD family putative folate metabolism protein [Luteitalea sp.]
MTLVNATAELIGGQRLLDHPFYVAWSKGELTAEALRRYATQYYHWVLAFPTYLSAVHANCEDIAMRQMLVANLVDEELGGSNHPGLWLRFCDALGLERQAVRTAALLPETQQAIHTFRTICREPPAVAGLAAIYAYEAQQPDVMRVKREGLSTFYDVTDGHDYFEVHETLDVAHSTQERQQIERLGAGKEAEVLQAVRAAVAATYVLLDGVERVRHG